MTKPNPSDRQSVTDRIFREIIKNEQTVRAASMARLRAERLGEAIPEPTRGKSKGRKG